MNQLFKGLLIQISSIVRYTDLEKFKIARVLQPFAQHTEFSKEKVAKHTLCVMLTVQKTRHEGLYRVAILTEERHNQHFHLIILLLVHL